ncbi:peroxiredoxin-like family protein [Amycolatopsis pigmentata]|uniref:thioredoxin-dependent peroxiredoxin n=1 Tax=Amycolatopsis pigmentata TaxID=450801 RepID=A0ABW5FP54_9PSEU
MPDKNTTVDDRLAEVRESVGRLPADIKATLQAEVARLAQEGLPAGVATPGTAMPDGDLLDAHGKPTTLTETRAGRPAVVILYRGVWCPYCNVALRFYQETLAGELDSRGVALVAISPQKPDGSLSVAEKHNLEYPVLSDPGNQVARGLGVVFSHSGELHAVQAKMGLDLTTVNADGTHELPLATAVVVDAAGTIRWIDARADYTTRSEPADILAAVDSL